jgi:hypothetical protein
MAVWVAAYSACTTCFHGGLLAAEAQRSTVQVHSTGAASGRGLQQKCHACLSVQVRGGGRGLAGTGARRGTGRLLGQKQSAHRAAAGVQVVLPSSRDEWAAERYARTCGVALTSTRGAFGSRGTTVAWWWWCHVVVVW